jgi:rfaE bifunctional protein nucleotidyltransferase chain/domain
VSAPIVPREEAARRCAQWQAAGLTVALANGAFDMLHVGHLRYLVGARATADRLVVAVNSDSSVRLGKGPRRPIVSESERAELVAHLEPVNLVVMFDERTVAPLLELLQPDVHAKGTDYTVATVPEREVVAAYGGATQICGDPKDHATTDVIATIVDRFADRDPE